MKKILLIGYSFFLIISGFSQKNNIPLYSMEHLSFAPDARALSLGMVGVSTTPDVYSIYWNPSKYSFATKNSGAGLSYMSFMPDAKSNYFYANVVGYFGLNFMDKSERLATSFSYYKKGESDIVDKQVFDQSQGKISPYDFSIDFAYSLKAKENLSAAVDLKFLYSDLGVSSTAIGVAGGVSVYYQNKFTYNRNDFDFALGANLSNLGTKMHNSPIPANLRIGGSLKTKFKEHSVMLSLELSKDLVPTMPQMNKDTIVSGKNNKVGAISGIFQSLNDAPGGFSEEIKETNISFGVEYSYMNMLYARLGYLSQDVSKGNNGGCCLGLGINYMDLTFDYAYVLPMNDYSLWNNNMMFTIAYNFDASSLTDLLPTFGEKKIKSNVTDIKRKASRKK